MVEPSYSLPHGKFLLPIIFSILAALVSPVADSFIMAPGAVSKPLASNTSGTIASRERISSDVFSADSQKLSWEGKSL